MIGRHLQMAVLYRRVKTSPTEACEGPALVPRQLVLFTSLSVMEHKPPAAPGPPASFTTEEELDPDGSHPQTPSPGNRT